jgi:hypothetical protein
MAKKTKLIRVDQEFADLIEFCAKDWDYSVTETSKYLAGIFGGKRLKKP